jgi:pilus assembly protein Flp/PilA
MQIACFSSLPNNLSEDEPMNHFAMKLKRFLKSEDGPTAVEYAVMLSLIIVVCLTAVTTIGTKSKSTFTNVSAQLGTGAAS